MPGFSVDDCGNIAQAKALKKPSELVTLNVLKQNDKNQNQPNKKYS